MCTFGLTVILAAREAVQGRIEVILPPLRRLACRPALLATALGLAFPSQGDAQCHRIATTTTSSVPTF